MTRPERSDAIDPYVGGRGNPGYVVTDYDLELDYAISSNLLDGRARISAVALDPLERFALDLAGLRVSRVAVDGIAARHRQRGEKLTVTPAGVVSAGSPFSIEVRYSGNPRPSRSPWGPLGWEELDDGVLVGSQPSGAPTWFPCNDLAAQKARFLVEVTAASSYEVVCNGELLSRRPRGSRTTWAYAQDEPASPYLMTLQLGRYERRDLHGAPMTMRVAAPPVLRDDVDAAFARLPEMGSLFVDRFGPYPFAAGYTVVVTADPLEVPLESQGQAVFGSNHLDAASERLVAHELAHQWFGNSLTAARWQDIWLHEGFACYAEWLWSEASGRETADAQAVRHLAALRDLPQDLLLGDPGPVDMFDDRVYKRGALTLHAVRLELGDDSFFGLLRSWASTNRHATVSTDAFVELAERHAGCELRPLIDDWVYRLPLPSLGRRG